MDEVENNFNEIESEISLEKEPSVYRIEPVEIVPINNDSIPKVIYDIDDIPEENVFAIHGEKFTSRLAMRLRDILDSVPGTSVIVLEFERSKPVRIQINHVNLKEFRIKFNLHFKR